MEQCLHFIKRMKAGLKVKKSKRVTSKNGGTFGFEKLLPGNYLLNENKSSYRLFVSN